MRRPGRRGRRPRWRPAAPPRAAFPLVACRHRARAKPRRLLPAKQVARPGQPQPRRAVAGSAAVGSRRALPLGATYDFRVEGNSEGPLWGTDVYPGDSSLGVAAVHKGLVRPGESIVAKVVSVPPPPQFRGTVRHDVSSHDFGRYGSAFALAAT